MTTAGEGSLSHHAGTHCAEARRVAVLTPRLTQVAGAYASRRPLLLEAKLHHPKEREAQRATPSGPSTTLFARTSVFGFDLKLLSTASSLTQFDSEGSSATRPPPPPPLTGPGPPDRLDRRCSPTPGLTSAAVAGKPGCLSGAKRKRRRRTNAGDCGQSSAIPRVRPKAHTAAIRISISPLQASASAAEDNHRHRVTVRRYERPLHPTPTALRLRRPLRSFGTTSFRLHNALHSQ